MNDRYDTRGNREAEFQPGSDGRVLANKLDITDPEEMDREELGLLNDLYEYVTNTVEEDQRLSMAEVCEWHRKWLGELYEWAGRTRTLNLSKGNFLFAAADRIPDLLVKLDRDLGCCTPCNTMTEEEVVEAIAYIHVEFILVHPFREGNGRIARLLATVMALQAGMPELDFSSWHESREHYFTAIQQGMAGDYGPMQELVRQALRDAGASA